MAHPWDENKRLWFSENAKNNLSFLIMTENYVIEIILELFTITFLLDVMELNFISLNYP